MVATGVLSHDTISPPASARSVISALVKGLPEGFKIWSASGASRCADGWLCRRETARGSPEASAWLTSDAVPTDRLSVVALGRTRRGPRSAAASMMSRSAARSMSAPRWSSSGLAIPRSYRVRSTGPGGSALADEMPAVRRLARTAAAVGLALPGCAGGVSGCSEYPARRADGYGDSDQTRPSPLPPTAWSGRRPTPWTGSGPGRRERTAAGCPSCPAETGWGPGSAVPRPRRVSARVGRSQEWSASHTRGARRPLGGGRPQVWAPGLLSGSACQGSIWAQRRRAARSTRPGHRIRRRPERDAAGCRW
jgi:hypothetical protein